MKFATKIHVNITHMKIILNTINTICGVIVLFD